MSKRNKLESTKSVKETQDDVIQIGVFLFYWLKNKFLILEEEEFSLPVKKPKTLCIYGNRQTNKCKFFYLK